MTRQQLLTKHAMLVNVPPGGAGYTKDMGGLLQQSGRDFLLYQPGKWVIRLHACPHD